jgi:hypothetical protein
VTNDSPAARPELVDADITAYLNDAEHGTSKQIEVLLPEHVRPEETAAPIKQDIVVGSD